MTGGVLTMQRKLFRLKPHLGIVHVPKEEVGLGIQDEVPSQELPTNITVFNVQEPTDPVLTIHIRHSGLLLASPWESEKHTGKIQALCKSPTIYTRIGQCNLWPSLSQMHSSWGCVFLLPFLELQRWVWARTVGATLYDRQHIRLCRLQVTWASLKSRPRVQ